MNEEIVVQDMEKSLKLVETQIKPIVKNLLSGWELETVEGNDNKICKILDMLCGVDYFLMSPKVSVVYGVASRVQYEKNYRTFTVRKSRESGALTEYEKRNQAIMLGGLYPAYTMQAYVLKDKVQGLALTKTVNLIDFIKKGYAEENRTNTEKIGQADFYVCKWDKMRYCGYEVREYKNK